MGPVRDPVHSRCDEGRDNLCEHVRRTYAAACRLPFLSLAVCLFSLRLAPSPVVGIPLSPILLSTVGERDHERGERFVFHRNRTPFGEIKCESCSRRARAQMNSGIRQYYTRFKRQLCAQEGRKPDLDILDSPGSPRRRYSGTP